MGTEPQEEVSTGWKRNGAKRLIANALLPVSSGPMVGMAGSERVVDRDTIAAIVDSEAAFTRSHQRFFSATYTYLAALARLDYALGRRQGTFLLKTEDAHEVQQIPPAEELPVPLRLPAIQ